MKPETHAVDQPASETHCPLLGLKGFATTWLEEPLSLLDEGAHTCNPEFGDRDRRILKFHASVS